MSIMWPVPSREDRMERQPVECARTGDVTNFDNFPGMEGIVVTLNCFFITEIKYISL